MRPFTYERAQSPAAAAAAAARTPHARYIAGGTNLLDKVIVRLADSSFSVSSGSGGQWGAGSAAS